jgi:DNA-directed RNA polymerase subunit RPC12/RpoP
MPKQTSLICENCRKQTLHIKQTPNHILHLLLTIITGGIWLIVWIPIIFFGSDKPWRCSVCGSKAAGSGWGVAGSIYREYKQAGLREQIDKEKITIKCPYCGTTSSIQGGAIINENDVSVCANCKKKFIIADSIA